MAGRFREILVWKKSFIEKFEGLLQSWIDVTDRYKIEMENPDTRPRTPLIRKLKTLCGNLSNKEKLRAISAPTFPRKRLQLISSFSSRASPTIRLSAKK